MTDLAVVWALGLLLKGTALLLLVALVAVALRRASAGVRHLVWSGGIVALLALPLVSMMLPWKLPVLATPPLHVLGTGSVQGTEAGPAQRLETGLAEGVGDAAQPAVSSNPTMLPGSNVAPTAHGNRATRSASPSAANGLAGQARAEARDASRGAPLPVQAASADPAGTSAAARPSILWSAGLIKVLLGVWIAGAIVLLGRLGLGAAVVRRIVRRASPLETPDWNRPLFEAADRLALDDVPRLVVSDRLPMPFACGVLHPVIVLPASATDWSDRRRRAVLCHELAHIRRRDLALNALGQLACAIYWFHPLVWLAARRLRMEGERACDNLVLGVGTRPSEYADHLLQIVCRAARVRTPAVALPMAERREFEGRMLAILERDARRDPPARRHAFALAGLAVALMLPLAALGPATSAVHPEGAVPEVRQANADAELGKLPADLPGPSSAAASITPHAPQQVGTQTEGQATSRQKTLESTRVESHQTTEQMTSQETQESARVDTQKLARQSRAQQDAQESVRVDTQKPAGQSGAQRDARTSLSQATSTLQEDVNPAASTGDDAKSQGAAGDGAKSQGAKRDGRSKDAWKDEASQGRDDPQVIAALMATLNDSVAGVREDAAYALGRLEATQALTALSERLVRDPAAGVRKMAAWALGQVESREATAALGRAVTSDASQDVRSMAAWALGQIEDPASVAALSSALVRDSSEEVRLRAGWAIGAIEPETAPDGLLAALGDPSAKVRMSAAWALGQIGDARATSALGRLLDDSSAQVRKAAFWALGQMGEAAQSALIAALKDSDPEIRASAARALAGGHMDPWPWPWPMPIVK